MTSRERRRNTAPPFPWPKISRVPRKLWTGSTVERLACAPVVYNPIFVPRRISREGEAMNSAPRCAPRIGAFLLLAILALPRLSAEPLPLKRAVELALAHSTTAAAANADQQRVFASYREARSQYIPQFILGSGLGKSWGYPLSLEGSAPSIVNFNSQSTSLQSGAARICPRRQDGLERGHTAVQRPAQPGDPGHGAELCRAEQVGNLVGTFAGRARGGAPNRATGEPTDQGGRG